MFSWPTHGQRAGAKLFWINMAIPAFIGDAHIGMALVTEFSLVGVAIHTGAIQTDGICLFVTRLVGSNPIPYDGEFPVLQKRFMIDPNEGLRFNALFLSLICGKFRLGDITGLSAHRIMPDRIGGQSQKDHEGRDDLAFVVHLKLRSLTVSSKWHIVSHHFAFCNFQFSLGVRGSPRRLVVLSFSPFSTNAFPTSS